MSNKAGMTKPPKKQPATNKPAKKPRVVKMGGKKGKPATTITIKHPGAFGAKAEAHGVSTSAYAAQVLKDGSHADATTKRQAALAKMFAKGRATQKKRKSGQKTGTAPASAPKGKKPPTKLKGTGQL